MMTSQISKFVDSSKQQQSKYLENVTLFFLQIDKLIRYTFRALIWKRQIVRGGNLKFYCIKKDGQTRVPLVFLFRNQILNIYIIFRFSVNNHVLGY